MGKPVCAYAKIKAQISCAVNGQLISAIVPASLSPLLPKTPNFKPLMIISQLCGCTAWFVSDLVEHPKYTFYHDGAHLVPRQNIDHNRSSAL